VRILGLDLGTKTLGVSVSDNTMIIASGVKTIRYNEDFDSLFKELDEIVNYYNVEKFVLGLPLNMNNTFGDAAKRSMEFKEKLEERYDIEVIMQDERLSSVTANNVLIDADLSRKKRKTKVDEVAAIIILQNYLDRRKEKWNG